MFSLVAKLRNCEIKKFILIFFFLFLIALIFRSWFFSFACLSSGDLGFFFKESIRELPILPSLWNTSNLGSMSLFNWSSPYSGITNAVSSFLNLSWPISVRIFWLWPFVVLSIFSSWYLIKQIFGKNSFLLSPFSFLIFISNTYILMIASGGQRGILLAYSIAPLVLGRFIQTTDNKKQRTGNRLCTLKQSRIMSFLQKQESIQDGFRIKCGMTKQDGFRIKCGMTKREIYTKNGFLRELLIFGLVFAVQMMFDLRIAYITLIACGLYVFYQWYLRKFSFSFLISHFSFLISILIVLGLHSYWLLPMVMNKSIGAENLGEAYTTANAVKYFSFAQFSNTISLLHPNWPENIFGKVYLMKGEFLVLPILAYGSLLFMNKNSWIVKWLDGQKKKGQGIKLPDRTNSNSTIQPSIHITILFFSFLGLIGAFLAKGANPPLGGVYLWLFEHFPGMIMFRDATKFYLLTALSYSVLIPFSVFNLANWIREITKNR